MYSVRGFEQLPSLSFTNHFHFRSLSMTNSNQIASVKELQIIRNFFTDSQWDVIDAALNEYQDHCEEVCVNFPYDSQEVLDTIGAKLQTVFDKTIKEN